MTEERYIFHVFHPGHSYVVTEDSAEPCVQVGEWEPKVYSLLPSTSVIYHSDTENHTYGFANWTEAGRFYVSGCGSRYQYDEKTGNLIYRESLTKNGDYLSMIVGRGDTEDDALANFAQFFRNPPDFHVMHETESFLPVDEWIKLKLTEFGIKPRADA